MGGLNSLPTSLCDRFDAMERAKDSDELRLEMVRFAKQMGFDRFAYVLTISAPTLKSQQYIINGYPDEWAQRYIAKGYFKVDPIIRHAGDSSLPLIWSAEMFQDGKSAEFWEEARVFGVRNGLSFGIHEQPGVTGLFSLARDVLIDLEGKDLAALIGHSQVFACLLHHAVARIALPKLLPEQAASLTARELECLKWAADGKTAWEIGRILNITERTAVFHLQNVAQKLGVTSKTQAVVRAVALRLV